MADLHLPETRTYAGDDSEGQILGIHFKNFLYIAAALLISTIVLLAMYQKSEGDLRGALAIGSLPLTFALIHVFVFRQGRPPAYDRDLVETLFHGKSWQPGFQFNPSPLLKTEASDHANT